MLRRILKKKINCHRRKESSYSKNRTIIIHNHVFKNAGSTIDWALHRNFGTGFVDHRDDQAMQKGASYLKAYLLANPSITALSTHHLRPPLPVVDGLDFMTIMMFRHPIERVISVYNFERKQSSSSTLGAQFARNHTLREYILWRMDPSIPPTIRNFHVFRTLPPPVDWREKTNNAALEKAKAYVDSLELLGIVECFEESMVLFEDILKNRFPGIDLSYMSQNVGQRPRGNLDQRLEWLRRRIGTEAFSLLEDQNKADLELYTYAACTNRKRLEKITQLDVKLNGLKNRCQRWIK